MRKSIDSVCEIMGGVGVVGHIGDRRSKSDHGGGYSGSRS